MRRRASKKAEATATESRLDKLRQALPHIKPGTPAPLLWAASGALFGLGISVAAAALSDTIGRNLQFVALLLSSLLKVFPVAMAGALIGAFVALGWFGVRR